MEKQKKLLKKKNEWYLKPWGVLIIISVFIFLFSALYFSWLVYQYKNAIENGDIITNNIIAQYSKYKNANSSGRVDRQELESVDSPSLGASEPLMTIVEFSDFNCPYCAISYPIFREFVLDHQEKVKLIFRNFPLHSLESAIAGRCAFKQNRFWDMHDRLFLNQDKISDQIIKRIAQEMHLDMTEFNNCYDAKEYQEAIKNDFALGVKAGVEGTPTIFVNGEKFAGVIPRSILEQMLLAVEQNQNKK